jgi:hypothetical protein
MGEPAPSVAGSGRRPDSLPARGERRLAQSRKIDLQRGSAAMALLTILMIALATVIISATSAERSTSSASRRRPSLWALRTMRSSPMPSRSNPIATRSGPAIYPALTWTMTATQS